jgi:hypothetical protein
MLVNVTAMDSPSASDSPEEVDFPQGFFDIQANGLAMGESIQISLTLHTGETPTAYWKFGPTADDASDHWYLFDYDGNTGAEIDGNIITLHFTDGARGDADLAENGQIRDPGAPATDAITTPVTLSHFDKQVTINWWLMLALAFLLAIGALRLRHVASQQQ